MKVLDEARLQRGWEVAQTIMEGLRSTDILPDAYPALFGGGVAEGSFHSYVLSALLLLGGQLEYSAVCDSPIFDRLDNLLIGEGSKRPDSIWFERGTETVRVLIEFERYTANSLEPKARNLLLMSNTCAEDVNLLVLMYWTVQVRDAAELRAACELSKRGFRSRGSQFGPGPCPMLLLETIVKRCGERLTISSFVAKQFIWLSGNWRGIPHMWGLASPAKVVQLAHHIQGGHQPWQFHSVLKIVPSPHCTFPWNYQGLKSSV